jgi:uncharacterized protein (DUF2141 family)
MGFKSVETYEIKLKISNIRSNEGRLQLQIYRDEASFKEEKPFKQIRISKDNMKNQYLEYTLTLEEGVYGFSFLDDENSNGKMDFGILPKEGFGFANYYHTSWSRPKFNDFKVLVDKNMYYNVKLRYL